jgi:oligopeptide/dipeptide ABC transporter ATP-binding protein
MTTGLQITDLAVEFRTPDHRWRPIDGVSLEIGAAEVVGVVGETGCGKTLTGLSVLRLLPRDAYIVRGSILFDGHELLELPASEMRRLRGSRIAMVFQNPRAAFNPVYTIGAQMRLVLNVQLGLDGRDAAGRIREVLADVGLPDADRMMQSYPHQLSGGMLQRAMVALALLCRPSLLIADEPTTAVDVTIAAQILELIRRLQREYGFSVMYITHDLAVVRQLCDRVVVLYAGRVAETAPADALFHTPHHPYTQGLLAAVPRASASGRSLRSIAGVVPADPGALPGCAFSDRCPSAFDRCRVDRPLLQSVGASSVACHLFTETAVA